MPCRIHIKAPDGSCVQPKGVLDPEYGDDTAPDLLLPDHYRKYLHLLHAKELSSVHLTRGEAAMTVPAGELQLFVSRGHEFRPVTTQFSVPAAGAARQHIVLERLEDMRGDGWYSGDMHTHISRWQPSDFQVWSRFMNAEDLVAVNNMVYKHDSLVYAPQYTYGPEGEQSHSHHHAGHHVMASGEEFRDDDMYGHMIAAGITDLIEPISVGHRLGGRESYPLFSSVCDWTHEQGGIAGWAHGGTLIKLHESLPIEAALGKLDFVENIQFNMFYGCVFWYRLLNCGIRLSCTGGSDFPFVADVLAPWYPNFGLDRTYVNVADEFSYSAWLEGIRGGACFASNGPLLSLQVNGQLPGAELELAHSEDAVLVEGRASCSYPLECLEIILNGAVIKRVEAKGGQTSIECSESVRPGHSGWVALRARGVVEPESYGGVAPWNLYAHTSPVYVIVGDAPIGIGSDLTAMADYVRMLMEIYRRQGNLGPGEHWDELAGNGRKAISFYENRLRSAF